MLHCFIASANYELKKSAWSVLCWGGCSVEITARHIGSWLLCWIFIPSLSLVEVLSVIIHACVCCLFSRVWLCNAMDCSPPGSSVHGILQARILDRVAMSFYRASSWPGDLPDPGIKPASLMSPALGGRFFTTSITWEAWCLKNNGRHVSQFWKLESPGWRQQETQCLVRYHFLVRRQLSSCHVLSDRRDKGALCSLF